MHISIVRVALSYGDLQDPAPCVVGGIKDDPDRKDNRKI